MLKKIFVMVIDLLVDSVHCKPVCLCVLTSTSYLVRTYSYVSVLQWKVGSIKILVNYLLDPFPSPNIEHVECLALQPFNMWKVRLRNNWILGDADFKFWHCKSIRNRDILTLIFKILVWCSVLLHECVKSPATIELYRYWCKWIGCHSNSSIGLELASS